MKRLGVILIISGFAITIYSLGADAYSRNINKRMIEQYEDISAEISESTTQELSESVSETVLQTTTQATYQTDINGISVVGIIEIPSINLKTAIGEGTDNYTLKYSIGHFEETPFPENGGNFCLAGHRSSVYGKFFSRLEEVSDGDEIIITRNNQTYIYRVCDKKTVQPNDVSGLEKGEYSEITLYTCTSDGKKRVMVKGHLEQAFFI